ncbi:hypothetical protein PSI9734_02336 [Pseudidiomarina piscicola]|uniref:Uncharacterized protein n=1 Tax=Pseudidiomarina piscicola TaxID=2614830 RepID=A0A6S6WSQ8_9GAMM|nr:hypothetical protein PSI9734_02336 [Pseudidiomarina piscicola]VZT41420.1 hypothetical protein PSI9734_02336 [Pseudomonas aeruginosa]
MLPETTLWLVILTFSPVATVLVAAAVVATNHALNGPNAG